MLTEAITKIENQRRNLDAASAQYEMGEAILFLCRENAEVARAVAASDKTVQGCYKHLEEYARKNRKGNSFCAGPEQTKKLIMEFYGVEEKAASAYRPVIAGNTINILDFMED